MVAALAIGPAYASGVQPNTSIFLNPGVTPEKDLIAWPLIEDTPQNTVVSSPAPTAVTPPAASSLSGFPVPTGAAVGLLSAIKNPNMSQATPDCAPPPTPQPTGCSCGGYAGTVTWSGWDQVSGGTCNGGSAGGWLTTQGGCYACPPPPPPAPTSGTFATGYGGTITYNAATGQATRCAGSTCQSGTVTTSGGSIDLSFSNDLSIFAGGNGSTENLTITGNSVTNSESGVGAVGSYTAGGTATGLTDPGGGAGSFCGSAVGGCNVNGQSVSSVNDVGSVTQIGSGTPGL